MPESLPYSLAMFAAAALQLGLAAVALRRRDVSGARAFAALTLASALYSAGYAMELGSMDLERILFWNHVEHFGIAFLPAFWAIYSVQVVGGRIPRTGVLILLGMSTISLVLVLTDSLHGQGHVAPRLRPDAPFPVLDFDRGTAYWFPVLYSNAVLLFGNVRLAMAMRRVPAPWRARYALLAAGSVLPWAGLLLYVSGSVPWGLDLTALSLAVATPLFAWGMFHLGMLDLVPVARDRVFEGMRDAVLVVDHLGRVLDFNPAARRVFPVLSARILGRPLADSGLPRVVVDGMTGPDDGEVDLELPGPQESRVFRGNVSSINAPGGSHAVRILTLVDVTAMASVLGELRTQAHTDLLTGTLSRRRFQEVLEIEISRSRRHGHSLSLLMMDLDHFKSVNDTFGHDAGDRVLMAVADSCREVIRGSDALGRLGGEEFAVLLPETGPMGARVAAERLRQRIEAQRVTTSDGSVIQVTVSIGVASADPAEPAELAALLDAADRGLYRAKQSGRNRVGRIDEPAPEPLITGF
jgi:diguanylate cyclase (GGDEF)-like protein